MKIRYILLSLILAFLSQLNTSAQNDSIKSDSLIHLKDLNFNSYLEQKFYSNLNKLSDTDIFRLSLAAKLQYPLTPEDDYLHKYFKLIYSLNENDLNTEKPEKQVKFIYKNVHKELLKKYTPTTAFNEIFENGNYNCVTASLLYAILLTHYKIPFIAKETNTHVFIVATPGSKSISIESTDPKKGYLSYNELYKAKFIEYLKAQKLTTSEEIQRMGIDSLFDKFHFAHKSINILQLIALQYCNNGINLIENEKYEDALNQLLKSYYLYPVEKSKYLIFSSLYNILQKTNYEQQKDWNNYVLITRFEGSLIGDESLKGEFERITNKLLIEKSDTLRYSKAFNLISSQLKDSALLSEISFIYYFELGKYYLVSQNYLQAYPLFEKAYTLQPNNYQVQSIFFETFTSSLNLIKKEDEAAEKIESFYNKYSKLKNNEKLIQFLINYYLNRANQLIYYNDWEDVNKYLTKFEQLETKYLNIDSNHLMIGEIYTKTAAYYYKRNDIKKAHEYIERGLKFAPDNNRLKSSKTMF